MDLVFEENLHGLSWLQCQPPGLESFLTPCRRRGPGLGLPGCWLISLDVFPTTNAFGLPRAGGLCVFVIPRPALTWVKKTDGFRKAKFPQGSLLGGYHNHGSVPSPNGRDYFDTKADRPQHT